MCFALLRLYVWCCLLLAIFPGICLVVCYERDPLCHGVRESEKLRGLKDMGKNFFWNGQGSKERLKVKEVYFWVSLAVILRVSLCVCFSSSRLVSLAV